MYSTVSEWDRIIKEQKAKRDAELLSEIERIAATAQPSTTNIQE